MGLEDDSGMIAPGLEDLPPPRDQSLDTIDVPRADDDRDFVEDAAVDDDLMAEPLQVVSVGLDLVAMKETVHDSNVGPRGAPKKAEFLEDYGLRFTGIAVRQEVSEPGLDLGFAARSKRAAARTPARATRCWRHIGSPAQATSSSPCRSR